MPADTLQAHARRADPATSHEAAASLDAPTLRQSQQDVLRVLREHGPLCDEELIALVDISALAWQSSSGIRTRRKELQRLGLVRPAGHAATMSGRRTLLWEAVSCD